MSWVNGGAAITLKMEAVLLRKTGARLSARSYKQLVQSDCAVQSDCYCYIQWMNCVMSRRLVASQSLLRAGFDPMSVHMKSRSTKWSASFRFPH